MSSSSHFAMWLVWSVGTHLHQCEKANSLGQTTNRCSREPQKLLLTTPHDVITPPHELTATPDSVRRTTEEFISVPTVEIRPQRQNILSYIKTIYLVSSQDFVLVGLCSVPHLNCKIKKKQEHWARRTVTFNYSNYDTHLLNKYDNLWWPLVVQPKGYLDRNRDF